MRTLLVLSLLLLTFAGAAPVASADHVQCADDPLTREPCEVAAALLNCVLHRPCSWPPP